MCDLLLLAKSMQMIKKYGLIGYPLSHSFSKKYFTEKFTKENLHGCSFELYSIPDINDIRIIIRDNISLLGLSVTIPYKKSVIPLLDTLDETAVKTDAVNSIKITIQSGKIILTGYNTDIFGFEQSLFKMPVQNIKNALVLGTGGAASAVEWVLNKHEISYLKVSRNPSNKNEISYAQITDELISEHKLIVNTTPLGMFPDITGYPEIPYHAITSGHVLFDLTYNPETTEFLKKGQARGAAIKNGLEMLHLQAEKSWEIWNDY